MRCRGKLANKNKMRRQRALPAPVCLDVRRWTEITRNPSCCVRMIAGLPLPSVQTSDNLQLYHKLQSHWPDAPPVWWRENRSRSFSTSGRDLTPNHICDKQHKGRVTSILQARDVFKLQLSVKPSPAHGCASTPAHPGFDATTTQKFASSAQRLFELATHTRASSTIDFKVRPSFARRWASNPVLRTNVTSPAM
jgi:hypothetical protein